MSSTDVVAKSISPNLRPGCSTTEFTSPQRSPSLEISLCARGHSSKQLPCVCNPHSVHPNQDVLSNIYDKKNGTYDADVGIVPHTGNEISANAAYKPSAEIKGISRAAQVCLEELPVPIQVPSTGRLPASVTVQLNMEWDLVGGKTPWTIKTNELAGRYNLTDAKRFMKFYKDKYERDVCKKFFLC